MILGIINTLYSVIPGTFKDYIATPRNNMYQAIHEIILGEKGVELEIQVCSYTMNRTSKYGITNYFSYIRKGEIKQELEFQKNLSGIHDSLELKSIIEDPKEFLNTLKSELLDDEIYIFTPKGDIKVLPKDATAIDFAYAIHDKIGNHMIGCKINSIAMPAITKLKNGNIVEIITSETKINPEKEWRNLVKTAKAKTQIVKLLKEKQEKDKKDITIEIIANDRRDLVLDITNIFTKNNKNIKSLITNLEKGQAQINIIIETNENDNIKELLEGIKNVDSVNRVEKNQEISFSEYK